MEQTSKVEHKAPPQAPPPPPPPVTVADQLRASDLPVYIKDREAELARLDHQLTAKTTEVAKQKAALDAEIATLMTRRDEAQEQAKKADKGVADAEGKAHKAQALAETITAAEAHLTEVREEVGRLEQRAIALAADEQQAEAKVNGLRAEHTQLTGKVQAITQQLDAFGVDEEAKDLGQLETRLKAALHELGRRHAILRAAEMAVGRPPTKTPRFDEALQELGMTERRPEDENPIPDVPPPLPGDGEEGEDDDDDPGQHAKGTRAAKRSR